MGREDHRERRARVADAVRIEAVEKHQEATLRSRSGKQTFCRRSDGDPWNPMETQVEKVTTVDIGKSRRLYITRVTIAESGQSPGCFGCTGVQKFHDENCQKRFERIYLHTAAVLTSASSTCARWWTSERPLVKYRTRSGWTGRKAVW